METRQPRIGEVYLVNFNGIGSEQRGLRPCVIFQNDVGNAFSPNVIVIPFTSRIKKHTLPTHVFLPAGRTGLRLDSIALCENPECVSKERLGGYLLTLPQEYMAKIAVANILASGAICFLDPDDLLPVWQQAASLNAANAA